LVCVRRFVYAVDGRAAGELSLPLRRVLAEPGNELAESARDPRVRVYRLRDSLRGSARYTRDVRPLSETTTQRFHASHALFEKALAELRAGLVIVPSVAWAPANFDHAEMREKPPVIARCALADLQCLGDLVERRWLVPQQEPPKHPPRRRRHPALSQVLAERCEE
jgi:hypothetical protein